MSDKVVHRSLGRLMNRLNEQTCAIITAYRDYDLNGDKISKEENIKRNRELRTRFVNNEMWAYSLVGHWQETNEVERSYVISRPRFMPEQEFTDFIKDYMTIDCLPQDACIIHTDKFYILQKDGTTKILGENISINKIEQAFSLWVRKRKLPFKFDYVDEPTSNFGRQYFHICHLLYFR